MTDLGHQFLVMREYHNRVQEMEKLAERQRQLIESRTTPMRRLRRALRINNNPAR